MNMKLFWLFTAALFVTLWWIAHLVTQVAIFMKTGKAYNDSGFLRLLGAAIIAILWALVYCM